MIDVLRIAHLRIAPQEGNLEVGNCEGNRSNRVKMNQIYSLEPNRRRKIFSIEPNLERMSKILGQRKQKVCRQALTAPGSLSLTTKYNAPPPLD